MRLALVTFTVCSTLASVEGLAWRWMNPPATSTSEPVLAYRPQANAGVPHAAQESANPTAQGTSFTITPLPDLYQQAAPMLRCSDGEACRIDTPDRLTLHIAWFEWNDSDTGSVLEAFRHMPEACLGSLGMKLLSKEKPIRHAVRAHSKSKIQNPKSATQWLCFDHTVFEEAEDVNTPLRTPVHSFRAVWVSGMEHADARQGIDGHELDRLRTIRLKAALERYRPRHARVIQGTVRGALTADAAWQAFERHMLHDLTLES